MKKHSLFVINTMGRGGAEVALIAMMKRIISAGWSVDLYVMLGQGELISRLPEGVRLLNREFDSSEVLSDQGRKVLLKTVAKDFFRHGSGFRNLHYMASSYRTMRRNKAVYKEKLLWKMISDAAPVPRNEYDLAVAYLEGAATYYVSDHVRAKKKAAFVHVDYELAGYTAELDHGCYENFNEIWGVSDEVKTAFLKVHPECEMRTGVFHNFIDVEDVRAKALLPGGFDDSFDGIRLLTVGRLVKQKQLETSIEAMQILKARAAERGEGLPIRWYVLGDGDQRAFLEQKIRDLNLEGAFVLLGVRDNPYPYYRQASIYVHCTAFEGRSIAISEAQILGKPLVVSDCSGNREQVRNGHDGILVPMDAEAIANAIEELAGNPAYAAKLGEQAALRNFDGGNLTKLLS